MIGLVHSVGINFVRWMNASDVLFDQLKYNSFSGPGPRALSVGVLVIASDAHGMCCPDSE